MTLNQTSELDDVSLNYPAIVKECEGIMAKEHNTATNEKFRMKQLGD